MPTITVSELISRLSEKPGAMFLSLETLTDARAKKTGNPFGKIAKRSKVNACCNFHYDQGVLRRLEKEGKSAAEFAKGESWHEAVLDSEGRMTPFARHRDTGEIYVRLMHISSGETAYFDEKGNEITKDECQAFLPKASSYGNQGLDAPLIFLTFKLSSIQAVTLAGERLVVEHDESLSEALKREESKLQELMV